MHFDLEECTFIRYKPPQVETHPNNKLLQPFHVLGLKKVGIVYKLFLMFRHFLKALL